MRLGLQPVTDDAGALLVIGRPTLRKAVVGDVVGFLQRSAKGKIDASKVSKLLKVFEKEPEVRAWREKLSEEQRFEWASPAAIIKWCPLFQSDKKASTKNQPTTANVADASKLARQLEQADARVQEIEEERDAVQEKLDALVGVFQAVIDASPQEAQASLLALIEAQAAELADLFTQPKPKSKTKKATKKPAIAAKAASKELA